MAQVTLAGVDGEKPPPLCMCCPTQPAPQLGRLDRTVKQFLSLSGVPDGSGRTVYGSPICVDPNARAPVVYANTVSAAVGLKDEAAAAITEAAEELEETASKIWENPELNFEEHYCHALLTDFLGAMDGVDVVPGYLDIPTAFKATAGSGKPVVAVCAEYDALPGIGHACGHNLISESSLAAFIGAKRAIDAGAPGTVVLLGTPAEEGGGGKVAMIDRGCFDDIDMAMMAHPSPSDALYPPFLCSTKVIVSYHGRNAHAAAAPWEGVNALDAVLQAFSNISMMRYALPV
jgi:metal-dependent amidase/aminoacylase/carboxypeptidase family protein|eukprot:COSAG06_NODE_7429_length_2508_cov_4.550436_4_plen_289_part_00